MKGRIAALDAACARVNPVLALIAAIIALLDDDSLDRTRALQPPSASLSLELVGQCLQFLRAHQFTCELLSCSRMALRVSTSCSSVSS